MTDQPTEDYEDYSTDLISIVVHDLKSPVSAARGFLELIQVTGTLNERQEHYLGRAMIALTRMETLIASLLDFARLEAGVALEITHVDLFALIDDALELFVDVASQRNIVIHVQASPQTTLSVPADERLLAHVFSNLLSNAIKYNRDGGQVWVRIIDQHSVVRVDVQDNGIGILPEDQPYVFDRFYRSRAKRGAAKVDGTGLGLAICQMVVHLHGGNIWVESTPGEGSTFSFTLPLHRQIEQRSRQRLQTAHPGGAGESLDGLDDDRQELFDEPDSESGQDAP